MQKQEVNDIYHIDKRPLNGVINFSVFSSQAVDQQLFKVWNADD